MNRLYYARHQVNRLATDSNLAIFNVPILARRRQANRLSWCQYRAASEVFQYRLRDIKRRFECRHSPTN